MEKAAVIVVAAGSGALVRLATVIAEIVTRLNVCGLGDVFGAGRFAQGCLIGCDLWRGVECLSESPSQAFPLLCHFEFNI